MDTNKRLDEFNTIGLYNSGATLKEISKKTNMTERTISKYLKKHGVSVIHGNRNIIVDKCIALYNSGLTCNEIALIMKSCRQKIARVLKSNGIIVKRKDLIKVNENIFDVIDTEEKAYWLGFLFADGNIAKKYKIISLNLGIKDLNHMEKFKQFISYSNNIKFGFSNGHKYCRLSFTCNHMYDKFISYGLTPAKSTTLKFPNKNIFSDESLIKDFIRGYVDGDGCLTWRNKIHTEPTMNIIGTFDFLTELQNFLPIGNRKLFRKHKDGNENIFVFACEENVAYRLSSFLYKDSKIYLERKYNVFLEYCRLREKSFK